MPREQLGADIFLDDSRLLAAAARDVQALERLQAEMMQTGMTAKEAFQGAAQSLGLLGEMGEQAAGGARGVGRFNTAAAQFSFIINDAQQFAYGFSQGLRAISNNLGPMLAGIKGLGRALMPTIIAVELASTAIFFLSQKSKDAAKEVDALSGAVKSLVDLSPIEITTRFTFENAEAMLAAADELDREARRIEQAAPTLGKAFQGLFSGTAAGAQTVAAFAGKTGEARAALQEEASELRKVSGELRAMGKALEATNRAAEILGGTQATAFDPAAAAAARREAERLADAWDSYGKTLEKAGGIASATELTPRAAGFTGAGIIDDFLSERQREAEARVRSFGSALRSVGVDVDAVAAKTADLAPSTTAALSAMQTGVDGLSFAIGDAVAGIVTMEDGWGSLSEAAASFGDLVKRVMQQVIADLAAATAKALILKTILAAAGGGPSGGGGGLLGSIISVVAGQGLGPLFGVGSPGSQAALPGVGVHRAATAPPQRVAVEVAMAATVLPGGALSLSQARHRRLQDK